MAPMSNGITVVQQYTMRLTWATRGQTLRGECVAILNLI